MKAILLAALILAGCDRQVTQPEGMTQPVPAPKMNEAAMIDPITAQNDYFLYHEKVKPAVLACIKKGLVKREDLQEMSDLNKTVAKEIPLATAAFKANDFEAWKLHHGILYRAMGRMLVLTNAVPIREKKYAL